MAKNACEQLAENAWKKKILLCSSYLGSPASASTQNKQEEH